MWCAWVGRFRRTAWTPGNCWRSRALRRRLHEGVSYLVADETLKQPGRSEGHVAILPRSQERMAALPVVNPRLFRQVHVPPIPQTIDGSDHDGARRTHHLHIEADVRRGVRMVVRHGADHNGIGLEGPRQMGHGGLVESSP